MEDNLNLLKKAELQNKSKNNYQAKIGKTLVKEK